jgi:uracil DNA glycosylase
MGFNNRRLTKSKHFLSDLKIQEQIEYVKNSLHTSYHKIFEKDDLIVKYLTSLYELLDIYREVNINKFHFKKKSSVKRNNKSVLRDEILFPRISELLRPFRTYHFLKVKVLFIFENPFPSPISQGIPLYNNMDYITNYPLSLFEISIKNLIELDVYRSFHEDFFEVLDINPKFNKLFVNDEGLVTFDLILNRVLRLNLNENESVISPFCISNPITNIESLRSQGILPIYYSLTNTSNNSILDHNIIWSDFTNTLIKNIVSEKENLIIVNFGYEVMNIVESLNLNTINNVTILNEPSLVKGNIKELCQNSFISTLNTQLSNNGLSLINWI